MKEYIEREAAINELTEENLVLNLDSVMDGLSNQIKRSAHRILASLPAANVVEVRHGEWHRLEVCDKWQCSECGVLMGIEGTPNENLLHYCPYCGAKMDGGVNDAAD